MNLRREWLWEKYMQACYYPECCVSMNVVRANESESEMERGRQTDKMNISNE